jgi:hypothetical protein
VGHYSIIIAFKAYSFYLYADGMVSDNLLYLSTSCFKEGKSSAAKPKPNLIILKIEKKASSGKGFVGIALIPSIPK